MGRAEGLPHPGVINCDSIMAVPKSALDPEPLGALDIVKQAELDRALQDDELDRSVFTEFLTRWNLARERNSDEELRQDRRTFLTGYQVGGR